GTTNTEVAYVGRGCPADSIDAGVPADPYIANPAGKVALIDRGGCFVSDKVDRAAKAGAVAVLIGLVAPGDPISFSIGGGDTFVPSLVITKAVSDAIKAHLDAPVRVTFGPTTAIGLAGNVVSSSSRGPSYSYGAIKPDIGAPGASRSAQVGTGTGETPFSGTSGAAPVVTGSAALVLQTCPTCSPTEVKARLMNTANINVFKNSALNPGVLAPVTRIGAGEVRVASAVAVRTQAWDGGDPEAVSLSIGTLRMTSNKTFQKKVVVRNLSPSPRTYTITPSFRYANDASSGAVNISAQPSVTVPANGTSTFVVEFNVIANALPAWNTNAGALGGVGDMLEGLEFDGYIELKDATETVRLPWQVLPHKAARVTPSASALTLAGGAATLSLTNVGGAASGAFDAFALTGTSAKYPASDLPRRGENYAIVDLKETGARLVDFSAGQPGLQFAITTWGERATPTHPAEFNIYVDTDGNGIPNFVVFNADSGVMTGSAPTGENLVWVWPLNTSGGAVGGPTAYAYSEADFNSANIVLTVPLSALGITPTTQITYTLLAFDNYYTGGVTDVISGVTYTPGTPKFLASPGTGVLLPGASTSLSVQAVAGGAAASPSQTGFLILYRDALKGSESSAIAVTP
ncbi:MAG TPA: S8 family serine peptidase, partial [Bryobacteraceae bacterium]|nr:S8 family serine peptidase [Bryobacteraceae bacterium]